VSKRGEAYFEITRVFQITGRGVVLAGQIRSGVVSVGMQVHLPLNSGFGITSTVKSVEFADYPGGLADVGLILDEESPELRSLWMQACTVGEVICLSETNGA
jgi:GTPase